MRVETPEIELRFNPLSKTAFLFPRECLQCGFSDLVTPAYSAAVIHVCDDGEEVIWRAA